MATDTLEFQLDIGSSEFERLYSGEAREVLARADDGRIVRFPLLALRPYVLRDGVRGRFRLRFDSDNRLLGLQRIAPG